MAERLLNNRTARRACILYELIQGKTPDNAYQSFCNNIRKVANKYNTFEYWFDRFLNVNMDLEENIGTLQNEDDLKMDQKALRYCILYEFLQKKPCGQAYQSFCKIVGKKIVDFKDFQFWFKRFESGKFDVDDEQESGLNPYSLPAMPIDIIGNVVDKLNLIDRLILRKVSQRLRNTIDTQKMDLEKLRISIHDRFTRFNFCDDFHQTIEYNQDECGCIVQYNGRKTLLYKGNQWEFAINDMSTFMKNKHLEIDLFEVSFVLGVPFHVYPEGNSMPNHNSKTRLKDLKSFFKSLDSPLLVRHVDIQSSEMDPIMSILPFLKPGHLEKITFSMEFEDPNIMEKVIQLNQWKQANELNMHNVHFTIPIENLFHFKHFVVFVPDFSSDDIVKIRNFLPQSTNFESCCIEFFEDEFSIDDVECVLGALDYDDVEDIFYWPVPNSDEIFEIQINYTSMNIKKHVVVSE